MTASDAAAMKFLSEVSRIVELGSSTRSRSESANRMSTVHVNDAKARLHELIAGLHPGEQLVIVDNREALATLTLRWR